MPRDIPTYTICAAPGVARSHQRMGGLTGFLITSFFRSKVLTVGAALLVLIGLVLANNPLTWAAFGAAIIVALTEVKDWYYNGRLLCIRDRDCATGTLISKPTAAFDGDRKLNLMLAPYTRQEWVITLLEHIFVSKDMLSNPGNFDDSPFHNSEAPEFDIEKLLKDDQELRDYMERLKSEDKKDKDAESNMYRQLLIGLVDRLMADPAKNFYNRYYRKDSSQIPVGSALWDAIPEDFDDGVDWQGANPQKEETHTNPYVQEGKEKQTLNPMFNYDIPLLVPYLHCEIEGYGVKLLIDNLFLAFSAWLAALIALGNLLGPFAPLGALLFALLMFLFKWLIDRITGNNGDAAEPDVDWEEPDIPEKESTERVGDVVIVYGNWIMDTEHYQYFEIHPVRAYYILAIDSQTEELVTLNSNKEQEKLKFVNADVTQIDRATADKRCKIITSAEEDAPSVGIERSAETALSYGMQTRYAGGGAQQEVVG